MKNGALVGVGVAIFGLVGCATLTPTAPPVSPEMVSVAEKRGASGADLEAGRSLLAVRCTSCHSLLPISAYTPAEWVANVEEMAPRARLSPAESAKVTAYLVAAREATVR
jgi:hypothetical protein